MGSSSHLPPYSSQPDPYPQPSPAQQARCLIPTKRLPAGGCAGETKAGRSCGSWGAPQRGPLTCSLARWGRRPRQTARCLLPAAASSFSSSLFYQPHRPQGLTERQRRGRKKRQREGEGGGQMNTMKRLTRTTMTTPPPPFIFGYGSLYSLRAGCCPLFLSPA